MSLPILTFHDISERESVISISPAVFREGMTKLHHDGYHAIGLGEAIGLLRQGIPIPARSFVITFDDGYEGVYREAFPVLERFGMQATIFLTTGKTEMINRAGRLPSLGGRAMLSWQEIKEMQQRGMTFGAHTLTHPDLVSLSREQAEHEMGKSKKVVEDMLAGPVEFFAYPLGSYNRQIRELAEKYFTGACSDKLGLAREASDLFALERVDAYYLRSRLLFRIMRTSLFPWYVGVRALPRQVRRWFR